MKLGVSYNLFDDSIELLEGSIKCIRPHVDHISVIIQFTSNWGTPMKMDKETFVKYLKTLQDVGMIDAIVSADNYLEPMAFGGKNELTKRRIGLMVAQQNECTHFMTMDSDEYYSPSQFANAKKMIEADNIGISFCKLQTYYKSPHYRLKTPEEYYVPFIYNIEGAQQFMYALGDPPYNDYLCDPTRRLRFDTQKSVHVFNREDIEMHHLSHVRNDYKYKLELSSALPNFAKLIDTFVKDHEEYQFPNTVAILGVHGRGKTELEMVEQLPWEN